MRAHHIIVLLAGAISIPGWVTLAHAQNAYGDGQDLPCNESCRAWMGPAYTGPDGHPSQAEPVSENPDPSASDDGVSAPAPDAVSPEASRHVARERVRVHHAHRIRDRDLAEDRGDDEPSRAHAVRKPTPEARHRVHAVVPVVATAPQPRPVASAETAVTTGQQLQAQRAATPGDPVAHVDRDAKSMTLSLTGVPGGPIRLTTAEADQLMQAGGAARATMQPQPKQNWSFGQTVATIYDPRWTTEAERKKGDTLLHIRDPRYGWLHYTVPRTTAHQLGNLLERQVALPTPLARRAEATP